MTQQTTRNPTKVLLVDSNERDSEQIRALIGRARSPFQVEWMPNDDGALQAFTAGGHDVVVLAPTEGDGALLGALRAARDPSNPRPVVLLWPGDWNVPGRDSIAHLGADELLVKTELTSALLERALHYAMERAYTAGQLERLARADHLTELPGRDELFSRLEAACARADHTGDTIALVSIDLDEFKLINDTLGHPAGDRVLRLVARRLTAAVSDVDTVARIGSNEFAIVLADVGSAQEAERRAQGIAQAFAEPIELPFARTKVSASIGVATYPTAEMDADRLVSAADAAMTRSKGVAGTSVTAYSAEMRRHTQARCEAEYALQCAYLDKEFRLVFQPQIDLTSGAIVGAEALLRWHPAGQKPRSPAEFIPVLETMDLIDDVGEWVVEAAATEAVRWRAAGHPDMCVSVNLSTRQFRRGDLVDRIAGALGRAGLPPQALEVEITETLLMEDMATTERTLARLREMGVRVAVDDFGTGYSSLGYLKGFPIDTLKIDRVFVRDAVESPDAAAIIGTIAALGHELRHQVVVEGVETEEQFRLVRSRRCDIVQGYFVARPMPPAELDQWLANHDQWCADNAHLFRKLSARHQTQDDVAPDAVLVVDDEPRVRRLLARILATRGLRVVEAGDLAEARHAIAREPELTTVFTDIHLPDGSGLDLIAPSDDPSAPAFVVMTGGAEVQDTVRAMRQGAVDFLTKPFAPDDLGAALDRAQRHRAITSRVWELEAARDRLSLPAPADTRWVA